MSDLLMLALVWILVPILSAVLMAALLLYAVGPALLRVAEGLA